MGKNMNKKTLGLLIAIATAAAYGAYPAAARGVYEDGGNAMFMLLVTTFTRAAALILFCLATGKKLLATRSDTLLAVRGGFFQAVFGICVFAALALLPGPVVIIIVFTHTIMLLFFMAWKKEIKLTSLAVVTTVCALCGLTLVLDIWHSEQTLSWLGIGIAFIGAIATMSRLYVYGKQTKTRNPAIIGAETFIFTSLFVLLVLFFNTPVLPASTWGYGLAALGGGSMALATFGMFYGIAILGSFQFSLLAKLEPIFTMLFSILLINEVLNTTQYVGIFIVIGSLIAYQYLDARRQKAAK